MIAASLIIAAVSLDRDARAAEPCATVVAPPALSETWAAAITELRDQIARLPVSDCEAMTLSLEPLEEGVRIVAVTNDGRRTERIARHPQSLVARALGLLVTIPEVAAPLPAQPPTPAVPAAAEAQPAASLRSPAVAATPRSPAVWAGLAGGLRVAAPTSLSVLEVEARADIIFDPWLMLVSLRSSVASCLGEQGLDCDVYNDASLGVGVGRRFRLGGPDVDIAVAPSVAVMHMEYDGPGAQGQAVEGTQATLRFDASARLVLPINPHWAMTITFDGGLAPSMLTTPTRLSLPVGPAAVGHQPPPFPAWSGGVRLGASGAVL